jgi:hypothetical protein
MYPTFPSFRHQPPDAPQHRFDTLPLSVLGFSYVLGGSSAIPEWTHKSGLRHSLAGSPLRPAESCSSSYGPTVHLQLLPTSPHGDAVTFSYRPENAYLGETRTPLIEYTLRRTRASFARLPRANRKPQGLAVKNRQASGKARPVRAIQLMTSRTL